MMFKNPRLIMSISQFVRILSLLLVSFLLPSCETGPDFSGDYIARPTQGGVELLARLHLEQSGRNLTGSLSVLDGSKHKTRYKITEGYIDDTQVMRLDFETDTEVKVSASAFGLGIDAPGLNPTLELVSTEAVNVNNPKISFASNFDVGGFMGLVVRGFLEADPKLADAAKKQTIVEFSRVGAR